jgi:hypothetical protein
MNIGKQEKKEVEKMKKKKFNIPSLKMIARWLKFKEII